MMGSSSILRQKFRLTDAIDRKLLCSFHYFGVTDSVDLSQVKWSRRDIEIHFMELPKPGLKPHKMDDRLVNWLMFINGAPKDRWEELAMDIPG